MDWRNCITLTKLHHPMWRNCIPGDLISSLRNFWFQHSTIYTIFNLKCISAQQIKENTSNFQSNSHVRMKYTACFADIHRKRRHDDTTWPYVRLKSVAHILSATGPEQRYSDLGLRASSRCQQQWRLTTGCCSGRSAHRQLPSCPFCFVTVKPDHRRRCWWERCPVCMCTRSSHARASAAVRSLSRRPG